MFDNEKLENAEDFFIKNHVDFQQTDISHIPFLISLPDNIKDYLKCMGKTIKWHETQFGSAWTTLYSVNDIMNCQETICRENNLLVIGNGLNGDLLTINLKNNYIGLFFMMICWKVIILI